MSDDNIILDPWNDNNNLLTKGDVYDIFEKAGFTNARDIITINDLSLYQTAFVHSSYVKKCIFDTLNKDGTQKILKYQINLKMRLIYLQNTKIMKIKNF